MYVYKRDPNQTAKNDRWWRKTDQTRWQCELTRMRLQEGKKHMTNVKINLIPIRMCCNFNYFMLDCCSSTCSQWILNIFHFPVDRIKSNNSISNANMRKTKMKTKRKRNEESTKRRQKIPIINNELYFHCFQKRIWFYFLGCVCMHISISAGEKVIRLNRMEISF